MANVLLAPVALSDRATLVFVVDLLERRRARPDARVLCVSGYTEDAVRKRVDDGGFAFLQKPITPGALTREIREVIDAR